jgi:hypothetical protein
MRIIQGLLWLSAIALFGCDTIKIEELPCPNKPEKICREQVKRLINKEWKLDGWEVDRFGPEGERFTAYRAGEVKYSEGYPSHANWFTTAKAKKFELTVVEMDSAETEILIRTDDKEVLYQLSFVNNDLRFVHRVPQGFKNADTLFSDSDTLFNANARKK